MTTTEENELAHVIYKGSGDTMQDHATHRYAAGILAAGWRKQRTITTVHELDALPLESVVRSDIGVTYEKDADVDEPDLPWWVPTGDSRMYPARRITLPATVLWEPTA